MKPTQDQLKRFVDNHVMLHQSMLVEKLFEDSVYYRDDVINAYEAIEWGEEVPQEVMQWFVVSDWLEEQLTKRWQPMLVTDEGTRWGRTCCGQAVLLDHIIQTIYVEEIMN